MSSNPCVIPTQPQDLEGDNRWLSIHKRFIQECKEKDPESNFSQNMFEQIIICLN
jgi:platelet-activating factor acetylhydrolase IB subunit beta/gamma